MQVDYTVDQVSEATIENGKSNFTLTKSGSNYVLKGQEAITLDQTAAGDIFSGVSGLSADEVIADLPPTWADMGSRIRRRQPPRNIRTALRACTSWGRADKRHRLLFHEAGRPEGLLDIEQRGHRLSQHGGFPASQEGEFPR